MISPTNAFAPYIDGGGLSLRITGGVVLLGTTPTTIADSVVSLTANATNFVLLNLSTGLFQVNTSGFTSGNYPIATVATNNTGIKSLIDSRSDVVTGGSGFVSSVFGRTGVVAATATDYASVLGLTLGDGSPQFISFQPTSIQIQDANGNSSFFNQDSLSTVSVPVNFVVGGIVSSYHGTATVGQGVSPVVAVSNLTAQTAAIAATTIFTTATQGLYRVNYVASVTRAASSSSTLGGATGFQVRYTDINDSVVKTSNPTTPVISAGNTTATTVSGTLLVYAAAATAIQYLFGYTSVGGTTMQYDLNIAVEWLQ